MITLALWHGHRVIGWWNKNTKTLEDCYRMIDIVGPQGMMIVPSTIHHPAFDLKKGDKTTYNFTVDELENLKSIEELAITNLAAAAEIEDYYCQMTDRKIKEYSIKWEEERQRLMKKHEAQTKKGFEPKIIT
jgi:hypothetical protein